MFMFLIFLNTFIMVCSERTVFYQEKIPQDIQYYRDINKSSHGLNINFNNLIMSIFDEYRNEKSDIMAYPKNLKMPWYPLFSCVSNAIYFGPEYIQYFDNDVFFNHDCLKYCRNINNEIYKDPKNRSDVHISCHSLLSANSVNSPSKKSVTFEECGNDRFLLKFMLFDCVKTFIVMTYIENPLRLNNSGFHSRDNKPAYLFPKLFNNVSEISGNLPSFTLLGDSDLISKTFNTSDNLIESVSRENDGKVGRNICKIMLFWKGFKIGVSTVTSAKLAKNNWIQMIIYEMTDKPKEPIRLPVKTKGVENALQLRQEDSCRLSSCMIHWTGLVIQKEVEYDNLTTSSMTSIKLIDTTGSINKESIRCFSASARRISVAKTNTHRMAGSENDERFHAVQTRQDYKSNQKIGKYIWYPLVFYVGIRLLEMCACLILGWCTGNSTRTVARVRKSIIKETR